MDKSTPSETRILSLLQTGPKTRLQIEEEAGFKYDRALQLVGDLKKKDLIFIIEYRRQTKQGRQSPVYAIRINPDQVDAVETRSPERIHRRIQEQNEAPNLLWNLLYDRTTQTA